MAFVHTIHCLTVGIDSCLMSLVPPADFDKLPFSQRVRVAGRISSLRSHVPGQTYKYHLFRLFIFVLAPCLSFALQPEAACDAAFKWLTVWALLVEFCGMGTMDGPLGSGQPVWAVRCDCLLVAFICH